MVNFVGSNLFLEAFFEADFMGKMIYMALVATSIATWTVLIFKLLSTRTMRKLATEFDDLCKKQRTTPLHLDIPAESAKPNPFLDIYLNLKRQTLGLLNKNRTFTQAKRNDDKGPSYLSPTDIDFVAAHVQSTISTQVKQLDEHLFILSTCVTLAPFLGLLGTVWGILTTFSGMQGNMGGQTSQAVLSGLSLALSTTVLGLIVAIPALIGYNYLKNGVKDFQTDMENFSNELLASVELQYRQVDLKPD